MIQWNRWRCHLYALLGYAAIAVLFTWPLVPNIATHLTGSPAGDTGVYVWNQWVFQHELLKNRQSPYFTDKIFLADRSREPESPQLHRVPGSGGASVHQRGSGWLRRSISYTC